MAKFIKLTEAEFKSDGIYRGKEFSLNFDFIFSYYESWYEHKNIMWESGEEDASPYTVIWSKDGSCFKVTQSKTEIDELLNIKKL